MPVSLPRFVIPLSKTPQLLLPVVDSADCGLEAVGDLLVLIRFIATRLYAADRLAELRICIGSSEFFLDLVDVENSFVLRPWIDGICIPRFDPPADLGPALLFFAAIQNQPSG